MIAFSGPNVLKLCSLALTSGLLAACASSFQDPGPITRHAPGASPLLDRSGPRLQCVPFARNRSGVRIFGDAHLWWDKAADRFERDDRPIPGAVMVFNGYKTDERGHVAVVRKILSEREISVDHANWLNKGEVQLDVPVMDVSDDNDWTRVRVWYVPGRHYGGRVYSVVGFIRPLTASGSEAVW